jgi:phosphoglycolate phosphatase
MRPMKIRAALIDLDGTLLDTAGDLAAAANRMLAALGRAPRTTRDVETYVGKGIARLVERSLTGELEKKADPELLEKALALFSAAYQEESGRHSRIYAGVTEGLAALVDNHLLIACATNKASRFAGPLLEAFSLKEKFKAIVCGDEVERGKPHPDCYLRAAELLGVSPAESIVIGDSANDVAAARAAGMRVLCVPYGYREGKAVESLRADAVVADLAAAAALIRKMDA